MAERSGVLVTLGALAGGQALALGALLAGWWPLALLLHLACILAAWLLRPPASRGGRLPAVLRLVAALLPAAGPAAVLGGLLTLLLVPPRVRRAGALPEDPVEARLVAIAEARNLPDGLLLEALGDVIHWGTAAQKAKAVALAARTAGPGGEALLRRALAGPDPRLREAAEAARPAAEAALAATADALRAAGRDTASRRALARHLDRAAGSGLLDRATALAFRAEAAGLWRLVSEAEPDDAEASAALGRDLLSLGDLPAARAALEAAMARGRTTPATLGCMAECLFRARDFAALDALVARWRPMVAEAAASHAPLAPAWRLWLAAGP
jgi:tetratricopeptide (TPR) repeat protein